MESYVGKDIRRVFADYGPPQNKYDMPEGKKAFQWVMTRTQTTPTYTTTTGNINSDSYLYGNNVTTNSDISATSTTTGGDIQVSKCFYTLYAGWDKNAKGWIVTNFEKPRLGCLQRKEGVQVTTWQQLDTPIRYFFDNALTGEAGRRKTEMIAELQTIAYTLSDGDLQIAVKQMRAFKQRRN